MARKTARPGRTLVVFFLAVAFAYGLVALGGTWKPALGLSGEALKVRLADRAFRDGVRAELATPTTFRLFNNEWDKVHVVEAARPEHARHEQREEGEREIEGHLGGERPGGADSLEVGIGGVDLQEAVVDPPVTRENARQAGPDREQRERRPVGGHDP